MTRYFFPDGEEFSTGTADNVFEVELLEEGDRIEMRVPSDLNKVVFSGVLRLDTFGYIAQLDECYPILNSMRRHSRGCHDDAKLAVIYAAELTVKYLQDTDRAPMNYIFPPK